MNPCLSTLVLAEQAADRATDLATDLATSIASSSACGFRGAWEATGRKARQISRPSTTLATITGTHSTIEDLCDERW